MATVRILEQEESPKGKVRLLPPESPRGVQILPPDREEEPKVDEVLGTSDEIRELNYDTIIERGLSDPQSVGNTFVINGKEFVLTQAAELNEINKEGVKNILGLKIKLNDKQLKEEAISSQPSFRPRLDDSAEAALANISERKVDPKQFNDAELAAAINEVRNLEQFGYVSEGSTGIFEQEAEFRLDEEELSPAGTLGRGIATGALRPLFKLASLKESIPAAIGEKIAGSGGFFEGVKRRTAAVGEAGTFTGKLEEAARPEITERGEGIGAAVALTAAGAGVGLTGGALIRNPITRLAKIGLADAVASGVYADELPGILTMLNDEEKTSFLNTALTASEGFLFSALGSLALDKVAARSMVKRMKGKSIEQAAQIISDESGVALDKARELLLRGEAGNANLQSKVGKIIEDTSKTVDTIPIDEQAALKGAQPIQETPVTGSVLDTKETMRARQAPNLDNVTFKPVEVAEAQKAKAVLGAKERPIRFKKTVSDIDVVPTEVVRGVDAVYETITKEEVLQGATDFVNTNGLEAAEARVLGVSEPSAQDYAIGRETLKRLIADGEYDRASNIIESIGQKASKQGQAIWSLSLFSTLDDEGAVFYAQKLLNESNKNLGRKAKKLTEKQIKNISSAARVAREASVQKKPIQVQTNKQAKLMEEITKVMPSDFFGQVSSLRKILMLINPKTFIRNIGGNSIMFTGEMAGEVADVALDAVVGRVTGKRTYVTPAFKERFGGILEPSRDFSAGFHNVIPKELLEAGGEGVSAKQYVKAFQEGLETMEAMAKLTSLNKFEISDVTDISKRVFTAPVLRHLENTLSLSLAVPDRAFFSSKFESSIKNIIELKRRAGHSVISPTKEDVERALFEASRAIFQDKNAISDTLKGARGAANIFGVGGTRQGVTRVGGFGAGDVILPFAQVPGSLLARGIEWSPFGFVKTGYEAMAPLFGREFNQAQFVRGFNRALLGSGGLVGTGMWLFDKGIITGLEHDDFELEKVYRQKGMDNYQVNVSALKRMFMTGDFEHRQESLEGDIVMDYDWAEPFSIAVAMGAAAQDGKLKPLKKGESPKNAAEMALDVFTSGIRTLEERPLLQGIVRPMEAMAYSGQGESKFMSAIYQTLADLPSSFVPTAAGQFVQWYDNNVKESRSDDRFQQMANRVRSRLGVGNLPPKRTTLGRQMVRYPDAGNTFFNVFLNPSFIKKIKSDPVLDEVIRLYEVTGETKQAPRSVPKTIKYRFPGQDKATKVILTPRQMSDLQGLFGRLTAESLLDMFNNPAYFELTPEDQTEVISREMSEIYSLSKDFMFSGEYDAMLRDELSKTKARDLSESIMENQPNVEIKTINRLNTIGEKKR